MGELFALLAAVVWAFAVICFRRSGETVPPFTLNVFRVTVTSVLFVLILAVLGEPLWGRAPARDYLVLFASGAIGIVLSDTLFHRCLNTVGAGITAVVDCLYSPFVTLFAFLLLGERLGPWQFAGMGAVIGGVILTSRASLPPGLTAASLLRGVGWGLLAMATLALGVVIAKPVLGHQPVLWVTAVRQVASLALMVPLVSLSPQRRRILAVFRPTSAWRFTLTGTILGSCLALLFWLAGMKYTQAGTAAILNQTSTIYVLMFASLFLHEPFMRRRLLSALLALAGIAMVTLG
jgi:drug/metabolite transporter (DMT)-like permease